MKKGVIAACGIAALALAGCRSPEQGSAGGAAVVGDASTAVAHRWDGQQYLWKNNSDRAVIIKLSNALSYETLYLGPHEEKASMLKDFRKPYQAVYE